MASSRIWKRDSIALALQVCLYPQKVEVLSFVDGMRAPERQDFGRFEYLKLRFSIFIEKRFEESGPSFLGLLFFAKKIGLKDIQQKALARPNFAGEFVLVERQFNW